MPLRSNSTPIPAIAVPDAVCCNRFISSRTSGLSGGLFAPNGLWESTPVCRPNTCSACERDQPANARTFARYLIPQFACVLTSPSQHSVSSALSQQILQTNVIEIVFRPAGRFSFAFSSSSDFKPVGVWTPFTSDIACAIPCPCANACRHTWL